MQIVMTLRKCYGLSEASELERIMLRQRIIQVYDALKEKGYNPMGQIAGYILTGDPAYITNHNGARNLISHIDREELLKELVIEYFERKCPCDE